MGITHTLLFCPLSLFYSLSPSLLLFSPHGQTDGRKTVFTVYCLCASLYFMVLIFWFNIPLAKYFGDDGRRVCWLLVKHAYPQCSKKGTLTSNSTTPTPATNITHAHIHSHILSTPHYHHHIRHATHTPSRTTRKKSIRFALVQSRSFPHCHHVTFLYIPQTFLFSFVHHIRLIPTQLLFSPLSLSQVKRAI